VAETKKKFYLGTGRRKTSVARVRIAEGTGKIAINKRPLEGFFTEDKDRNSVLGPLLLTEMRSRLDVFVNVRGGGYSGQAGAICQGLARALKGMFGTMPGEPAPAPPPSADGEAAKPEAPTESLISKKLRDSGYLTRDGRMKERKKYGRKGARKSFQFSKR
jgi:small subunit ribosomal protein S9